jgi:hypothetical protein
MIPKKGFTLLNRVKFDGSTTLGSEFVEQVWLTGEHGFTYGGTGGTKRTLNSSEVAESQLATLQPNSIYFRSEVVIDLMSRARSKGEAAFEGYVTALLRNSKKAFDKRLEIAMRYGGSPIGTLTSATDAGTTSVLTITAGSWMPGAWLGSRNCAIDAYEGSTKLNQDGDLNVTIVNMSAKTVTVVGDADDINAIVASGTSGSGVTLYFKGAYGLDGTGLRTIANLTTGDYLGISADTYKDVWNGTQVTWDVSTTTFNWTLLQTGLEQMASRGMEGDVYVDVPLNVWGQLNSSLAALRAIDSSYSVEKAEQGHGVDAISYHAVTGRALIRPSSYVKFGDVMVSPDPSEDSSMLRRIGSSNVTFETPGKGGEMFKFIDDTNTVEWRAFSDQALYLPAPRNAGLFTA